MFMIVCLGGKMRKGLVIYVLVILLIIVGIYIVYESSSITGSSFINVGEITDYSIESSWIWLINVLVGILLVTVIAAKRIESKFIAVSEKAEDLVWREKPKKSFFAEDISDIDKEIRRLRSELGEG